VPLALVHYVDRIRVLPEIVLLLTIDISHAPYAADDAMRFDRLPGNILRLTIERGFMDHSNVPRLLEGAVSRFQIPLDPYTATYCLGRETFLATSAGNMGALSEGLFAFLARNAHSPASSFCIPPEQVIEIGSQIDL
jgi:KUP system potassium uptake protein